jgi:hypothetical protein
MAFTLAQIRADVLNILKGGCKLSGLLPRQQTRQATLCQQDVAS